MDSRLTALKFLQGRSHLIEEFTSYYTKLIDAHDFVDNKPLLREARKILDEQVQYVADLALQCEDRPPGQG